MRVRKIITLLLIFVLTVSFFKATSYTAKATSNAIVISEISMGSENSASEEFVEVYNNSDNDISMSGWGLYYKSATGKTWTKKASFAATNTIKAHSFLTASSFFSADASLTSGMSQTGGVIELKDNIGAVIDLVGWGNADTFEGRVAAEPEAGESIYRQYDEATKTMVDSNDNLDDYYITTNPTPGAVAKIEQATDDKSISYPPIQITELFPDPTSPQSDSTDEFIELYNPTSNPIDLSGWVLKDAGNTSFILKDKTIPANSYLAVTSAESSISLNNSGDAITLIDPSGSTVDETPDYGTAKEGLSWALVGGSWVWTVSPTPNSVNSAPIVDTESSPSSATKKAATKKAAAKTTAKKATAKPKTSAAKAAKATKDVSPSANSESSNQTNNIWSWLLIVLGIGTIGYGIYEYRPEIANFYYRLKAKFAARKNFG